MQISPEPTEWHRTHWPLSRMEPISKSNPKVAEANYISAKRLTRSSDDQGINFLNIGIFILHDIPDADLDFAKVHAETWHQLATN